MPTGPKLILYSRPDCHLCDEAAGLLAAVAPGMPFQAVDIEPDLGLLVKYGEAVPVLRRADNDAELFWPFDAAALRAFLGHARAGTGQEKTGG